MTVDQVLSRLKGVKPTGDAAWIARCPAHDDRDPSLSIGLGTDDRVLLTCHAGCSAEEIVGAVGLTMTDLFADDPKDRNGRIPGRPSRSKRKGKPPEALPSNEELDEWRRALLDNSAALNKLRQLKGWAAPALEKLEVGVHDRRLRFPIRDEHGQLINVVKYAPRREDGESKSIALRGRPRGLFPAPEIVSGAEVWLVEGEPDAVSAATLGLSAVAVPGVKGWKPEYARRFSGKRVVVCADCDKPGRGLADKIAADLTAAEVEFRRVDLAPDRTDGYDLGDHLLTSRTVGDARDALLALAGKSPLQGPEPPLQTAELLAQVISVIRRFVVLGEEQLDALGLWVLHTYALEAADTTPYLAITSPEKRSGKSRLLEVLCQLVARPMEAVNVSEAALFRSLGGGEGELPKTLLFDEIDTVFGKKQAQAKEDLRGLINAGYRRGQVAWRCVGDGSNQQAVPFPVFGPKALAGIGELPDTIADRSIPIRLRRRSREEPVERGRHKTIRAAAGPVAEAAGRWAKKAVDDLAKAEPTLPDQLSDRAQDGAEPLLAIADAAGGDWPKRARASLVSLHGERPDEEDSWGVHLLTDIRAAFEGQDRLSTAELLEALKDEEEAPWAAWGKAGDGLSPRNLATLLRRYDIRSRSIRLDSGETPKGFKREQFEDAWTRYLPQSGVLNATLDTSASQSQKPGLFDPPQDLRVADEKEGANPHSRAEVAGVAAEKQNREGGDAKGPPCRYPNHRERGRDYAVGNRTICGVCHPRVGSSG